MNGLLGSRTLYKAITQSVYVCDKSDGSIITINICNRNNKPVTIRIAISDSVNSITTSEYIEYDVEIAAKGVLERTGVAVGLNQYITVYASENNVTVSCWGSDMGDSQTVTPVSDNTTPNWVTNSADLIVYAGRTTALPLLVSDPIEKTYSITSGSAPSNLTLNATTATLTGTTGTAGYTSAGVTTIMDVTATGTGSPVVKSFSILRKWYDGSTEALAGTSAADIKNTTGTTTNGQYWIKPTNGSGIAFQTYCIMNRDGGGWMKAIQFSNLFNLSSSDHVYKNGAWTQAEINYHPGKISARDWTALNTTNSFIFRVTNGSDNLLNNGAATGKLSYTGTLPPFGTDLDPAGTYTMSLDMTSDGTYEYSATYVDDPRGRCNHTTNFWISDHNYNGSFSATPPYNSIPICWTIGFDRVVTNLHWMSGLASQSAGSTLWGSEAPFAIFIK